MSWRNGGALNRRVSRGLLAAGAILLTASAVSGQDAESQPLPRPEGAWPVRVEKSVLVPMRDGVRLSTDLYVPVGAEPPLPAVLLRTPYNKAPYRRDDSVARFFASHGYVVAVQDKRGKWESEGIYTVSGGDAEDGYDTVEWLSRRPWSNGKVGTYGCSYLGDVQIFQAPLRHPALAALIPQASGSSVGPAGGRYRYFGARNGGAFELAAGMGWFLNAGSKLFYRPPEWAADSTRAVWGELFHPGPAQPAVVHRELWWTLPLVDLMDVAGAPPTDWKDLVSRAPADPWWDGFGYLKGDERIDVPALFVNSWYDFGVRETLFQFGFFRERAVGAVARGNQYLIISPTSHCASERATVNTVVGRRPVGDARYPYWETYLAWYDRWLRGSAGAFRDVPRVQYYLMGRNEWRAADAWPIPGTRPTDWYLRSGGRANSRFGDGTLSMEPAGGAAADRFVYDPATPVPSLGGPVCCTGTPDAPEGAFDQRPVQARHDVLVYTSEPLAEGVEVTGVIDVILYVSSSARDTDFTAKLVDVHPDGTAYNVQEGILRARYREGFDREVFMEPGEVYEVRIDLQATANWFGPGHRIRLEVSSSNFPRFDRNLNTGGRNVDESEWRVAENVVHHSARFPSRVVLPVVPAGASRPLARPGLDPQATQP